MRVGLKSFATIVSDFLSRRVHHREQRVLFLQIGEFFFQCIVISIGDFRRSLPIIKLIVPGDDFAELANTLFRGLRRHE
jgi:hypothetical protein